MAVRPRILVIGSPELATRTRRALPDGEVVGAEHALSGVWQFGNESFDDVLISLSVGQNALRALRSIRELSSRSRVIVTCTPPQEPTARLALAQGADDYVIEPVGDEELRAVLGRRLPAAHPASSNGSQASLAELLEFSDVLQNLSDGPQATLDRLAAMIQRSYRARGVAIRLDELVAAIGATDESAVEEVIYRQSQPIGRITLGPRQEGAYPAAAAGRLTDLARLVEAAVQQARERDRLAALAWRDDLSGLHNRRFFNAKLDELLNVATDRQSRVTVLLFDIDDFKHYNDEYGHATGDELIREIGALLKRCSRADDVVARYGGDEFGVIFWDAEQPRVAGSRHPSEPIALCERFRRAIADHDFACLGATAPGPVTISGGLACFPWHGSTREALLGAADRALLNAKRVGKNRLLLAGEEFAENTT